jgi:hypothetical protein
VGWSAGAGPLPGGPQARCTHVAAQLHQLVVQLAALALRLGGGVLQVGHLGEQLVDHVALLGVAQHLLQRAELACGGSGGAAGLDARRHFAKRPGRARAARVGGRAGGRWGLTLQVREARVLVQQVLLQVQHLAVARLQLAHHLSQLGLQPGPGRAVLLQLRGGAAGGRAVWAARKARVRQPCDGLY